MTAQHVDLVDHIDLEAATGWRKPSLLEELLDLAHPAVRGGIDLDVIHKTPRIDLLAAAALTTGFGHHTGLAIQGLGKNPRQGGLAHPSGTGKQIGVVQSLAGEGMLQGLDDMVLTHHRCELSGTPLAGEHHRGLSTSGTACGG